MLNSFNIVSLFYLLFIRLAVLSAVPLQTAESSSITSPQQLLVIPAGDVSNSAPILIKPSATLAEATAIEGTTLTTIAKESTKIKSKPEESTGTIRTSVKQLPELMQESSGPVKSLTRNKKRISERNRKDPSKRVKHERIQAGGGRIGFVKTKYHAK